LCLTKEDGTVENGWTKDVQGNVLLDALYEHVKGEPVLVFPHKWMEYEHPKNGQVCSIDSRGLNDLKHFLKAGCFQHGNLSTNDAKSLGVLAEMMGLSSEQIREAVTYERFYESSLQCLTRTAIRDQDNRSEVSLFVQNEDMATYLKGCLGEIATIDMSLAHSPHPSRRSAEAIAKTDVRNRAIYLVQEEGLSRSETAKHLHQHLSNVKRWTRGLKHVA
jgi:hypothetical protein